MFEIEGKVAIISGGASGIGFQCAIELLKNGLRGVTIVDINEEFGKEALIEISQQFGDNKAIFVKTDVTNKVEFEDAFKKTLEHFKNVDILINCAGLLDDRVWEKEIDINIKGVINGSLLALQDYIKNYKSGSEGVILNFSSVAGTDPAPSFPIYCATKYAIVGFTRSIGSDLHYNISGVRAFAICPGLTNTRLVSNLGSKSLRSEYAKFIKNIDQLVSQVPQHVARNSTDLIKTAPGGSVWVVENTQSPYEFSYLSRHEVKKLKSTV